MIDFAVFSKAAADYDQSTPLASAVTTEFIEGLRYRFYQGSIPAENIVIVYHGGGVNIDAGYDILARQWVAESKLSICLVDIRGHGESTGVKGQLSHPDRLWQDVDLLISWLKQPYPDAKFHLLGHSSGAGMLINYFTRHTPMQEVTSLILLAPELGPFAKGIHRKITAEPFASVSKWPFILNGLTGGKLFGNYPAVRLSFPVNIDANVGKLVRHYSVNMANALTPHSPAKQLSMLPLPTLMLAADKDELFDSKAMADFAEKHGNHLLNFKLLNDSHHLDCMFHASVLSVDFIQHALSP